MLVAFIVLAVIALLNLCEKEHNLPNDRLTCVDYTVVQTIIVAILLLVDSVAVFIAGNNYYAHSIIPIVAGVLVFVMNFYLIGKYSSYLFKRYAALAKLHATHMKMPAYLRFVDTQFPISALGEERRCVHSALLRYRKSESTTPYLVH